MSQVGEIGTGLELAVDLALAQQRIERLEAAFDCTTAMLEILANPKSYGRDLTAIPVHVRTLASATLVRAREALEQQPPTARAGG